MSALQACFELTKPRIVAMVLPARAVDNALYIFYANQAGKSGNAWFPGLAFAINPNGQFIDEHAPVEGMIVTEVSRDLIELVSKLWVRFFV